MKTITCDQLTDDYVIVDVRSPREYSDHHIPGAISVPLLYNPEHHEVGLLYAKVGAKEAYDKGFEFIVNKIEKMIQALMPYKHKKILIHCARGGMRSRSVTVLFENLGFDVTQLEGGMKSYKNFILEEIKNFKYPKLIVLQGYTGSAKTKYIEQLPNSIDLEKCANHQSSLFGAVGLKPNSQKMFTFLLYENLKRIQKYKTVFIEGEARRVGDVHIPESLWRQMEKAHTIFLNVSIENRAKHIVKEYPDCEKHSEEYIAIIKKLKKWISTETSEELVEQFKQKDYYSVVKTLLEKYYDPRYKHFMKDMKITETVDANDFSETLKRLKEYN